MRKKSLKVKYNKKDPQTNENGKKGFKWLTVTLSTFIFVMILFLKHNAQCYTRQKMCNKILRIMTYNKVIIHGMSSAVHVYLFFA